MYVGYQKESHRLLLVKSVVDIHESLDIRSSLLWRYPQMSLTTKLQHAHIYLFKHWIIGLIAENPKISSIKSDLVPLLAKLQWQSALLKTLTILGSTPPHISTNAVPLPESTPSPSLPKNLQTASPVNISLYIAKDATCRANSILTYILLNQSLALQAPDPKKHPSSKAGAKTSVGQDSLVGPDCVLGERVQIRGSVLAEKVNVESRAQVRGSVVMTGVSIGENARLEGCVISRGAKIGNNVQLTECFVGAGYTVKDGTKVARQNLVELEELEEDDT
jgi:translation initiation factor eIF-2B subunit gamma